MERTQIQQYVKRQRPRRDQIMEIIGSYHTDTELYFLKDMQSYREVIKKQTRKTEYALQNGLGSQPQDECLQLIENI